LKKRLAAASRLFLLRPEAFVLSILGFRFWILDWDQKTDSGLVKASLPIQNRKSKIQNRSADFFGFFGALKKESFLGRAPKKSDECAGPRAE
jgi:hypothetical protein